MSVPCSPPLLLFFLFRVFSFFGFFFILVSEWKGGGGWWFFFLIQNFESIHDEYLAQANESQRKIHWNELDLQKKKSIRADMKQKKKCVRCGHRSSISIKKNEKSESDDRVKGNRKSKREEEDEGGDAEEEEEEVENEVGEREREKKGRSLFCFIRHRAIGRVRCLFTAYCAVPLAEKSWNTATLLLLLLLLLLLPSAFQRPESRTEEQKRTGRTISFLFFFMCSTISFSLASFSWNGPRKQSTDQVSHLFTEFFFY